MKRKSGLHKKVSSIFGDTSLPEAQSVKTPLADNDVASSAKTGPAATDLPTSIVGGHSSKAQYQHHAPVSLALTEEQEYAASQRRKLFVMVGLCVVFALVLFFNFYQPEKKPAAHQDMLSDTAITMQASEIYWPEPGIWPADIRDPMVFKADAAKLYAVESNIEGPFVLRGIVHKPDGGSMALLGTEIFYEGDEIQGWTIGKISLDSVKLNKPDGKKLELRMEDR